MRIDTSPLETNSMGFGALICGKKFVACLFLCLLFIPQSSWSLEVIVDNDTAGVMTAWTGTWTTSVGTSPYGTTSKYSSTAGSTAVWTPNLPQEGTYQVYVWYTSLSGRDQQAPYTVTHLNGTADVALNQATKGGQWNLLGTYCFAAGTTGNVSLSRINDGTHDSHTNADSVKFVLVPDASLNISETPLDAQMQPAPANIMFVLDDSGSMDWEFMTSENDGLFESKRYVFDNPGDNLYSGILTGSSRGKWKSQWAGYNKMYYDPDVTYTPWPSTTTKTMNQADPDTPRAHPDHTTPTFAMSNTYHTIEQTPVGAVIVDNKDGGPGFTTSSSWYESGALPEYSGSSYYSSSTNITATWTPTIPSSGDYDVYAFWSCGQNQSGQCSWSRDTSAPYTINYNGGSALVTKSQRYDYGQWNLLGTYNFQAGTTGNIVLQHLSGHANTSADAVMFVPTGSAIADVTIINAHYYTYDDVDGDDVFDAGETIYLVNIKNPVEYYTVDNTDADNLVEASELVSVAAAAVPATVKTFADPTSATAYIDERQNFANWYSYYRRRELSATAAVSSVVNGLSGVRVGIRSINGKIIQPVMKISPGSADDQTGDLLNILYSYNVSAQGTPLRTGLQKVGQYYHQSDGLTGGLGTSPIVGSVEGGECQQNFAIVMTDGYYNGSSPGVGNVDSDNGAPYTDSVTNTLADVAMYYYENDLAPGLSDQVPATEEDTATHQHLVTFSISFGVTGSLTPSDYDISGGIYPTWTNPFSGTTTERNLHKIDDMWHASVNGRGTFVSAGNPVELTTALVSVLKNIESRSGSAASVSVNGDELFESIDTGIKMFQSSYNTDGWWGDLVAYGLDTDTGAVDTDVPLWNAATVLENFLDSVTGGYDNRIIATLNSTTEIGTPFRYASLSAAQQALLDSNATTAQNILNYVRGDNSLETANGGSYRDRDKRLGDIVHSMAVYDTANNTLYVGSNDGMLHAYNPDDGTELFSYVPNKVFANLNELPLTTYSHKYFVDLSPNIGQMVDTTYLVGGLGRGGKGYYCLDVTNPATIDSEATLATRVKWEYPSSTTSAADTDNMGYSYSQAYILKSNYTTLNAGTDLAGYVIVFANGYGSTSGKAMLYFLDPATGSVITSIDTEIASGNGLSSPAAIDENNDYLVDSLYAGDLKGNMWKFDVTDTNPANWDIAYKDGATPKPLFTVKMPDTSCDYPAITSRPDIMSSCADISGDKTPGYMVIFGTGRYLSDTDLVDTTQQTVYGVWDYGDAADDSEYLGTFDPVSTPILSNQPAAVSLLKQTDIFNGEDVIADFTAVETDTPNSAQVTFTDASSGTITSRAWDFDGDGTTDSTILNPVYVYAVVGTYDVSLTAERTVPLPYTANTKHATITVDHPWLVSVATELDEDTVLVDQDLMANFTGAPSNDPSQALVAFTDKSKSVDDTLVSWSWNFGDGSSSSVRNPTHIYASTGSYMVDLTVTDSDGVADIKSNVAYITVDYPWQVNIELVSGNAQYQDLRVLSNDDSHYCPQDDGAQEDNPGTCYDDVSTADVDEGTYDSHAGWYFDLPTEKERVVSDVFIRDGKAIVISFVPQESKCSTGGFSYVHELDACSGGRLSSAVFDINFDKLINQEDLIWISDPNNPNGPKIQVAPTAKRFSGRLQPPAILRDPNNDTEIKYFSSSAGNIVMQREKAEQRGMFLWRMIE